MKVHFRTLKMKVVTFILYRTFYNHAAGRQDAAARINFACPLCTDSAPKSVCKFAKNWEFRGEGWLEGFGVLFWHVILFRFCVTLVYITSLTPLHVILSQANTTIHVDISRSSPCYCLSNYFKKLYLGRIAKTSGTSGWIFEISSEIVRKRSGLQPVALKSSGFLYQALNSLVFCQKKTIS